VTLVKKGPTALAKGGQIHQKYSSRHRPMYWILTMFINVVILKIFAPKNFDSKYS
jgi:hypothetical protein